MTNRLDELTEALRCLPGVGPKSAQRMCYHLLQHGRKNALHLAKSLTMAMEHIKHCQRCNNFCENDCCPICSDDKRTRQLLCIVESPNDLATIEQTQTFKGTYFVLMGRLSPLDGIGPEQIGLPKLEQLIQKESVSEIIFALNPSIESEATIHYISNLLTGTTIKFSQLARGIPLGSELEYLDINTIAKALKDRDAVLF
jgi:recombination protein RecR